jgi:hypothetical protein
MGLFSIKQILLLVNKYNMRASITLQTFLFYLMIYMKLFHLF